MPEIQSDRAPWPNQTPPVDGIVPVDEVPQDPDLFDDVEDDDLEMED